MEEDQEQEQKEDEDDEEEGRGRRRRQDVVEEKRHLGVTAFSLACLWA